MRESVTFGGIVLFLAILFGLALLTGCGNDADFSTRDKGSAEAIINMPDNFPSVAVKCFRGNGVYTSGQGSGEVAAPFVVSNDRVCR